MRSSDKINERAIGNQWMVANKNVDRLATWRIILDRVDVVLCLVEFSRRRQGDDEGCGEFPLSRKIGGRRLYSTKRGVNNLKILLIEGTVFYFHVRENFLKGTSIMPYSEHSSQR